MNPPDDINWQKKAVAQQKNYAQYLKRANKRNVIKVLPSLNDKVFEKVDCLQCAACCKNYSPRFKTTDIKRISKHFKMKEAAFIDAHLKLDEEGDYVVKQSPCPFLGSDNYCSIYDVRPSDCARFPYIDEDVLLNRPKLTLKNASFCPAVFEAMEHLLDKKVGL